MPIEKYFQLFREDYLKIQLPLESEITCVAPIDENVIKTINPVSRLSWRERIDKWADRYFIETRTENIKILNNYLNLCKVNNVLPIMFLPPFTEAYMKNFSREKLDEFHSLIRVIQKKHSDAIFIDGWKFNVFSDEDFFDVHHMNIRGAAKFSTILDSIIEKIQLLE